MSVAGAGRLGDFQIGVGDFPGTPSLTAGVRALRAAKKVLCIGPPGEVVETAVRRLELELVQTANVAEATDLLSKQQFEGLWISQTGPARNEVLAGWILSGTMLQELPQGVALLDHHHRVVWANRRLLSWTDTQTIVPGITLYELLGNPEIIGPDFCPFHTAMATGAESSSILHDRLNRYFQVHVAPVVSSSLPSSGVVDHDPVLSEGGEVPKHLIVTLGDVTKELLQQQKLAAIHKAGRELADLRPTEIFMMEVDDRIELLKENIRHYLRDLLNFEVIEIRLLEHATGNLVPLLSVGIDQAAADRKLFAQPRGNGITGYVAASGMSYICQDVVNDPLFIPGVADSKSSLTVPLILHDQILGTINVESFEVDAFSDSDLQFLEIFARDVAFALNTLELLVAQKANTAQQSCDAIHSAVALPVDEILNDAVNVMEGYIGHQGEIVDRLRRILKNARDIKQTIQQIGQRMTPLEAVPVGMKSEHHALLAGKRILVVDEDHSVRDDAHRLLERYGCIVETAHEGKEAVMMVRGSGGDGSYDVIISDIKLPDFSGYQLMCRLSEIMTRVPMVLMTGFGYDPGHSIVKARQAGLHPKAVLFKPFRLDQLIDVVETILEVNRKEAAV